MEDTTYQLKYCERCGSLGLRRSDSLETYCQRCGQTLINYSFPGDRGRRSLLRRAQTETQPPLKLAGEAHSWSPLGRLQ